MSAAQAIAEALGNGYRSGDWWRCRCPVHGSSGAALALRDGPTGLTAYCHAECSRNDVFEELARLGFLYGAEMPAAPDPEEIERQRAREERGRLRRTAAAIDYWLNDTAPPTDTIVGRYWEARGLTEMPIPETIRSSLGWLRHPSGGARPAMIALVEHVERGRVAIHRTWLQVDGAAKASLSPSRMALGPVGGAAIRLAPATEYEPLVIGEGIETTASVMLATGYPGWAAISAGGIERLVLPPLPIAAVVIIGADHDQNGTGERAARAAAARWLAEGRQVRLALPPQAGTDWNDVLNEGEARNAA